MKMVLLSILLLLGGCMYSSSLRRMSDSELNREFLRWQTELNQRVAASAATPRPSLSLASTIPIYPSPIYPSYEPYGYGSPLGAGLKAFSEGFERGRAWGEQAKIAKKLADPYNVSEAQEKLQAIYEEMKRRGLSPPGF